MKFKKIAVMMMTLVILASSISIVAFAEEGDPPRRRDISYYDLDIEELGVMDIIPGTINGAANAIFQFAGTIAGVTCDLFAWSDNFSVNNLFGSTDNTTDGIGAVVQKGKTQIFDPLFDLAVACMSLGLVWLMFKRNFTAIMGQLLQTCLLFAFAMIIATNAGPLVDKINGITDEIANKFIVVLSGSSTNKTQTANTQLWKNLVEDPWQELEFMGSSFTKEQKEEREAHAEELLSMSPGDEPRKEKVKELAKDKKTFSKGIIFGRLGYSFMYLFIAIVKSAIFLVFAGIKILFKILFALLVIISPLVLLMAIVPALGGMNIVVAWLRKAFEIQMTVIMTSLFVGLILALDNFCYKLLGTNASWQWVTVGTLQILLMTLIVVFRDKIFSLIEITGARVSNGRGADTFNNLGHGWSQTERSIENKYKQFSNQHNQNKNKNRNNNNGTGDSSTGEKKQSVIVQGAQAVGTVAAETGRTISMGALAVAHQSAAFNYAEDRIKTTAYIAGSEISDKVNAAKTSTVNWASGKVNTYVTDRTQRHAAFADTADRAIITAAPQLAQKIHIGQTIEGYKEEKKDTTQAQVNMERIIQKGSLPDYDYLPEPMEQRPPIEQHPSMTGAQTSQMYRQLQEAKRSQETPRPQQPGAKIQTSPLSAPTDRPAAISEKRIQPSKEIAPQGSNANVIDFARAQEQRPKGTKSIANSKMYFPSTDEVVVPFKMTSIASSAPHRTEATPAERPKLGDIAASKAASPKRTQRPNPSSVAQKQTSTSRGIPMQNKIKPSSTKNQVRGGTIEKHRPKSAAAL